MAHLRLSTEEKGFLAWFFASFFALYFLIRVADLSILTQALASWQAASLRFAGLEAVSSGNFLVVNGLPFQFVPECTGLVLVALFAALVCPTMANARKKLEAFAFYAPLLLVFNFARILATLAIASAVPSVFPVVHFVLWIVDSIVVLLAWMNAFKIGVTR